MLLKPATSLEDAYQTLSLGPLIEPDEFDAFYRKDINKVRGGDKVARMVLGLKRAHGGRFYKVLLMGHSGVGKSTEITRLTRQVKKQFRAIRFSALSDLDAAGFKPFDVLLVMMIKLTEAMQDLEAEGIVEAAPASLLEAVWQWFATEERTVMRDTTTELSASAGIGPKPTSWLALATGLFATIKGDLKYAADRKEKITQYRLNRISTLLELTNRLLDECQARLRQAESREWLFIGEDFDKQGIPAALIEDLFVNHRNIFQNLQTHLIFTVPVALVYSDKAALLPTSHECIPDTPVFDQKHEVYVDGRHVVSLILEARIVPDLFEADQEMRLVVASGGNLRDLFYLVGAAADNALLRPDSNGKINHEDATRAINDLRAQYERRLGVGQFDTAAITYKDKADRLVQIYEGEPIAAVPDPVLHSLLRARAILEFNGERWFGVHPLVVDILHKQGKLKLKGKSAPGGTY